MSHRAVLLWMLLILLVGTATRLYQIGERSLWEDEGWTLLLTQGDTPSAVVQTMAYDQHPPLFFVLFKYWRAATGEGELPFRMLSAFAGILSIAALYQLGRVLFKPQVGVIAAGLFAVWDFAIDVSQDARQYSLLLLFVILSCTYFFRYVRQPSRANGLGWLITSILVLYTQYVGGVVLLFQALYALVMVRPLPRLGDVLARFALIGIAFAPWLLVFIRQNQVRWDFPIFYQSALPNDEATFILIRDALVSQQFGLIIGLALLGLLVIRYAPDLTFSLNRNTLFLLAWFALYCLLFIYLNAERPILRIRIFVVVLPPLLLLVAHGLMQFQRVPQVFLLGVLLITHLTTIDTRQNNPPWREVTHNVTAFHQAGEPVLLDIWVGDFPVRYYVEQQMGATWLSLRELRDSARDQFLPYLVGYLQDHDAFWLIRWNDDPSEYDPVLADQGFQRTFSTYVEHVDNRLYSHRYDRLSDQRLGTFGEALDLVKASVQQAERDLTITLWWAARAPLPVDYSISIRLLDESGALITNQDAPPLNGLVPTSTWQVGQIQYDQHRFRLPPHLPAGNYQIALSVYWYVDPDHPLPVNTDEGTTLRVEQIEVP